MVWLFTLALIATALLATAGFVLSVVARKASLADVFWGLHFVVMALALWIMTPAHNAVQAAATLLVLVWGLRLSVHLGHRNIPGPEDARYVAHRQRWGRWFLPRSFLEHFLLQAVLATVVALPLVVAGNAGMLLPGLHGWQWLALALWLVGFAIESTADSELAAFVRNRRGRTVLQTGLWHYSRHPNYFGEITQWWALWLLVAGLPYGWVAAISPLLLTTLIVFVSGIPTAEARRKDDPEYQEYMRRTSVLIPLPPYKS